jgi:hypothetical protein
MTFARSQCPCACATRLRQLLSTRQRAWLSPKCDERVWFKDFNEVAQVRQSPRAANQIQQSSPGAGKGWTISSTLHWVSRIPTTIQSISSYLEVYLTILSI